MEKCEDYAATAPECDESSPDFDPKKCSRNGVTCFLRAFGDVSKCIIPNQAETLSNMVETAVEPEQKVLQWYTGIRPP